MKTPRIRGFFPTLIVIVIILLSYGYIRGIRFDARRAAETNRYIDKESVLLGKAAVNSHEIFFYENEDQYHIIMTERAFFGWKPSNSSFYAKKTNDPVEMVGRYSMAASRDGNGLTAIAVQSCDKDVSCIAMGPVDNRIEKDITCGDAVIFTWNTSIRWNDLNAIAYSDDGNPLYLLAYEIAGGQIKADELRWLPVNE